MENFIFKIKYIQKKPISFHSVPIKYAVGKIKLINHLRNNNTLQVINIYLFWGFPNQGFQYEAWNNMANSERQGKIWKKKNYRPILWPVQFQFQTALPVPSPWTICSTRSLRMWIRQSIDRVRTAVIHRPISGGTTLALSPLQGGTTHSHRCRQVNYTNCRWH